MSNRQREGMSDPGHHNRLINNAHAALAVIMTAGTLRAFKAVAQTRQGRKEGDVPVLLAPLTLDVVGSMPEARSFALLT